MNIRDDADGRRTDNGRETCRPFRSGQVLLQAEDCRMPGVAGYICVAFSHGCQRSFLLPQSKTTKDKDLEHSTVNMAKFTIITITASTLVLLGQHILAAPAPAGHLQARDPCSSIAGDGYKYCSTRPDGQAGSAVYTCANQHSEYVDVCSGSCWDNKNGQAGCN